jgi:hypothetical protein
MKTLLEWTPEGVPLEDFIRENEKELSKTRIFYIVQANSDKNKVTKIGIAGTKSGRSRGRLDEYIQFHGYNNNRNPAQGVKIIACYGTAYNPKVKSSDSFVYKLEQKVKAKIKDNAEALKRGKERTTYTLRHLKQFLVDKDIIKEEETDTRKSPRVEKQDKINKVLKTLT